MIIDISALVDNSLYKSNKIGLTDKIQFLEVFESVDIIENDELSLNEEKNIDIENILLSIINTVFKTTDNDIHHSDNISNKDVSNAMKYISNYQGNVDKEILINNIVEKKNLGDENKKDIEVLFNKSEVKVKLETILSNIEINKETFELDLGSNSNNQSKEFTTENLLYKSISHINKNNKEITILNNIVTQYDKPYIPTKQAESTLIREEFVTKDIVKTINYLKNNDMQELKVNLSPKDLGDITIKLIKSETDTTVLITLSEDETFELVNKNLKDIQNHLSSLDIKVKDISVEVRTENQNFFSDDFNQNFDRNNSNHNNQRNFNENEKNIENQDDINKEEDSINLFA